MFNLEQAIAAWRQKVSDSGLKALPLQELESHLRDEFEALVKTGIKERQAFDTATQRIGQAERLKREFDKIESKTGNRAALGITTLYCLVAGGAALFKLGSFADVSSVQQLSALAAVALAAASIFAGPLFAKVAPAISNHRLRMAIYGLGSLCVFAWLALFYQHVMTRAEWNMSQLVVGILWAWIPLALLCGVLIGMEKKAHV